MSRATLTTLLALAAGLALAPSAHGCTLAAPATQDPVEAAQQRVRSADVAIYGVVSSVRMLDDAAEADAPRPIGQDFEARVRVTRVFRGMTVRVIRVRGNTDGATCGIGLLRVRQRVGLLLDRPARPFQVSLASRTTLSELLQGTEGRWRSPL
jgi:hypothetical protein